VPSEAETSVYLTLQSTAKWYSTFWSSLMFWKSRICQWTHAIWFLHGWQIQMYCSALLHH